MSANEVFVPENVPGIYNLENEVYHASTGISSSGLKLFSRSPKHFWDRYRNPERESDKSTPAKELGTQIHAAILEPKSYFETYYPLPEKYNRATKQGKIDHEFHESEAAAKGQQLISKENHDICCKITEAVRDSDSADYLFSLDGLVEQSFYWRDERTNVLCKCRPDKLLTGRNVILDLKSTASASVEDFSRSIANYQYHISAQFYRRGVQAVTGQDMPAFIFCAFETDSPYACAFYQADEDMLERADRFIDSQLEHYKECLAYDEWPGYSDSIRQISLPGWVK
jgi:hypothetical protein